MNVRFWCAKCGVYEDVAVPLHKFDAATKVFTMVCIECKNKV